MAVAALADHPDRRRSRPPALSSSKLPWTATSCPPCTTKFRAAAGVRGLGRHVPAVPGHAWRWASRFQYLQVRVMQKVGQETMYDLRKEIFDHLQRLPMSFYDRSPVGRLVTRVTTDVDALNDLFASGIAAMVNDAFLLVVFVVIMLRMNWRLALATFAVMPLHLRGHLDLSRQGPRRQSPHPHRHRAHQRLPAGTHQRHERRAALQPRKKIARAVRRPQPPAHGSLQGRHPGLRALLSRPSNFSASSPSSPSSGTAACERSPARSRSAC